MLTGDPAYYKTIEGDMRSMVWFRRDLRVHDHPALVHGCQYGQEGTLAVYIIDRQMWQQNDNSEIQIRFILSGLPVLKESLKKIGVPLCVYSVQKTDAIPLLLQELAERHGISRLFWNREDEANESQRDRAVMVHCDRHHLSYEVFCDQLILDTAAVQTGSGGYFQIFTPFKRRWQTVYRAQSPRMLSVPKAFKPLKLSAETEILPDAASLPHWPSGEKEALRRLSHFCREAVFKYDRLRDFPSQQGTSQLSPYLATGMLSPRTCFQTALRANGDELDSGDKGALMFMSELIWREFYRHILVHVPRVSRGRPYRPETEKLVWSKNAACLQAWQQGRTGFPFVDAGMRQLNQLGWMHNRLRMVTAMFLTKNLLQDWRLGEAYFAAHLVDFDFASNNGGWQWSASTGTDAVPWFRVFNPVLQGQRFDATGEFIRQYCPELSGFSDRDIHQPWHYQPKLAHQVGYPEPIVDIAASRQRVLAAFGGLKGV